MADGPRPGCGDLDPTQVVEQRVDETREQLIAAVGANLEQVCAKPGKGYGSHG